MKAAAWSSMSDLIRTAAGRPSPVSDTRVVFNIHHNHSRLIADIDFQRQVLFIKFLGTHTEYDKVDARTVSHH